MGISVANRFQQEIIEDLNIQRMQDNTRRAFSDQANTGIQSGCLSGTITTVSTGVYKVAHGLGRRPIGFILTESSDADSVFGEIIDNPTSDPVDVNSFIFLKFSDKSQNTDGIFPPGDPGTFRVFLY